MERDLHPDSPRPLIDPVAFEEAGRSFRLWLDRLLGRDVPEEDTSIAWETGEPEEEDGRPRY